MKIYEYSQFRPMLHSNDTSDYLFAVTATDPDHADRIFKAQQGDDFDSSFYHRKERLICGGLVFKPIGAWTIL